MFRRIANEQNYEQKDSAIFDDLNNLAYAAFHNGIGRPELTKQKLKDFLKSMEKKLVYLKLHACDSLSLDYTFIIWLSRLKKIFMVV